jgi:meiotic recombination protein SPO11
VVQQLLQQNKHCSKRDVFYMYPSFFVGACLSTAVVDRLRIELKVSYVLLLVL